MADYSRDQDIGKTTTEETVREVLVDLKVDENLKSTRVTVERQEETLEDIKEGIDLIHGEDAEEGE